MTGPRIGSLFSGAGMLDEGVRAVLGGTVAWHAEIDPAASKVLEYRYPDVPNLGDVSAVDWAQVEPVDVITGGSPCQDVSHAGKRAGMRAGTRSGLWARMCDAIEAIRPSLVVWENVRGVLSAEADSALEPCAGCVGDGDDGPVLRALGRVLGDLADLGYDCRWHGLRAADVGAPHGRFRVFVVASARNPDRGDCNRRTAAGQQRQAGSPPGPATDAANLGHERGRPARGRRDGSTDSRGSTADAPRSRLEGRGIAHGNDGQAHGGRHLQPARIRAVDMDAAAADTDRDALRLESVAERRRSGETVAGLTVQWGQYEPAIRRWEHVTGQPAPAPTEPGPRGGQRLSPRLTEWMMGWPDGWVTDVPGVSRNDALKICGNGVVPQQATAALRTMLSASEAVA